MVAAYVSRLETLISPARLNRYRATTADDLQVLTAYLWNVSLSESLLQSIAAVEIGLRNSVDRAFSRQHGPLWYSHVLSAADFAKLCRTYPGLINPGKPAPLPGRVISDWTFGFWLHLFEISYDPLWSNRQLKAVFPNHPRTHIQSNWLTRKRVFDRLTTFRELRNRAMHHEPILYGVARTDRGPNVVIPLAEVHSQMVEMLDWIDPQLCQNLLFVDRFKKIHGRERQIIENRLKKHFESLEQMGSTMT